MLNFQITMTLCLFAAVFLLMIVPVALVFLGEAAIASVEQSPIFIALLICLPVPLILIGIFCTYQGVVNAMRRCQTSRCTIHLSIPFVNEAAAGI